MALERDDYIWSSLSQPYGDQRSMCAGVHASVADKKDEDDNVDKGTSTVTVSAGASCGKDTYEDAYDYGVYTLAGYYHSGSSGASTSKEVGVGILNGSDNVVAAGSTTFDFKKEHSSKTITVFGFVGGRDIGDYGDWDGSAEAKTTVTIPALPSYTITYNANGGSCSKTSDTKWYDEDLTLPSATRTGYRFLGWAETSTATTAAYSVGDSYTTDAATTLYAVWESIYSVIYYKTDGETEYLTSSIGLDGTLRITSTVPPISKGYRFLGWKSSLDNEIYSIGGIISNIDKNISLFPVIEKYPYSFCIKTTEEKVLGMCVKTSDEEKVSDFCIKI